MGRSSLLVLFLWTLCLVRGQSPSTSVPSTSVPSTPFPLPECPSGFEFQECGTACPQTCADVQRPSPRPCTLQCVRGCFCAAGTVLQSENSSVCVTPNSCPEPRCPPGFEFQECGTACPQTCADVQRPFPRPCTLQCVRGCFCPAGKVLRSENSSVCVTSNSCLEHCLPVLTISVPIKVLARGRNVCPSQGNRMTNITRFLANQIVRQYRANAGGCRISDVQRTSCAVHGRSRNLRSALTYNATLSCGNPCQRVRQDDKSSIQLYKERRNHLNEVHKERHTANVEYDGFSVRISYFQGRKGSRTVTQKCSGPKISRIRGKVDTCTCPDTCPDVCALPPVMGPCEAYFPRYFYNSTSRRCECFIYGGCRGNDNNFETLRECQTRCAPTTTSTPPTPLTCPTSPTPPTRPTRPTRPTPTTPSCPGDKVYTTCGSACPTTCSNFRNPPFCITLCVSGCFCPSGTVELGDSNRCVAPDTCQDVCELSPSPGPCRAAFRRYFYNSTSEQCEQFIYGGCRGNANNFETQESCIAWCTSTEPESGSTTVDPTRMTTDPDPDKTEESRSRG